MSESEYKELVLADYDRKKLAGQLSSELMHPTPGSLKAEGVKICERRFDPKDAILLQSFFNQRDNATGYRLAIQNCKADIFRQVVKLIKERTINTKLKNTNLLAWLIDFQPRPYYYGLNIVAQPVKPVQPDNIKGIGIAGGKEEDSALKEEEEEETIGGTVQESATTPATTTTVDRKIEKPPVPPDKKIDRRWFIGIAAFLVLGVIIWGYLPGGRNCMYWDNDHYVATSCDVPRLDTPLVHLDPAKLRGFRRIKHVDTLTYNSVNKLWYVRVGGIIEVYSAEGKHPLYPNKKLTRLTYYAVNVCQKQHE